MLTSIFLVLFINHRAIASDSRSFNISSGFLFLSSNEETPDGSAKIEDKNLSFEMGYIAPYGVYLGFKFIQNEKKINLDSQLATAYGPSIGLIFPSYYFSIVATSLVDYSYVYVNYYDEDQQDGSFSRIKTNTTYLGKNAFVIDLNLIPGDGALRIGPSFTFISFDYEKLQFESTFIGNSAGPNPRDNTTTKSEIALESGTWRDSWILPYLKLSLIF